MKFVKTPRMLYQSKMDKLRRHHGLTPSKPVIECPALQTAQPMAVPQALQPQTSLMPLLDETAHIRRMPTRPTVH